MTKPIHKFVPITYMGQKRLGCKRCAMIHVHPNHATDFCYLTYVTIWFRGKEFKFTSENAARKALFFTDVSNEI